MSDPLHTLVSLFTRFPGIGPRQARRFAYFLLKQDKTSIDRLTAAIQALKAGMVQCSSCYRYFNRSANEQRTECSICLDPNREQTTLMVVEKDVDIESIERSSEFTGRYFVLGGLVPILDKEPDRQIRSKELVATVSQLAQSGNLGEIILAVSANSEGDNTIEYLKSLLAPLVETGRLRISTLGRGLSTGTELEYSDNDTIRNALKNRA